MSKQVAASPDDGERPSGVVEIREAEPPPWWQTTAFRAFAEVRRAFARSGVSRGEIKTTEQAARTIVFWAVYEIGHALDEIERFEREGRSVSARVSFTRHEPGRMTFEIIVTPREEVLPARA